jgi:hypothetical protein
MDQLLPNINLDIESTAEKKGKLEKRFRNGANSFYWIAGLSLVNSIIWLLGSKTMFLMGLGITQLLDMIAITISENTGPVVRYIAFVFDLLAAMVFVVFGLFANRKQAWAFIIGIVIYGLDGLIFLLVMDWWSIGFHVFVIIMIISGFVAYREMRYVGPVPTAQTEGIE